MFSNTFPLAPLFSVLTNILEIRIKLDAMCFYSRRFVPEGASGIGAWIDVIEFLVIISIPINCAIMFYTGQNSYTGD
jgi:hypothetical protein